jgi:DNA-binding transcriptional LysR family regulator
MANSFRDMRLFVAAYEERSFTAAAGREHATQSGVSQHVRNLEESLGVKLFTRDKGRVLPTPAGDAFYRRSVEVLRAMQDAGAAARSYAGGLGGELVIGLMPTMTRCALAPVLARFIDEHPNLRVRVVEGYSALLTQQVQAGELAFAIVPAFPGAAGLRSRLFLRTPELLVSRAAAGLSHGEPIRLAELAPLKIVVPSQANTRRRLLETYFASNGVAIERVLELDAMLGTLDFVARTDWMTILPAILIGEEAGGPFAVNPIVDPVFELDLVLIERARQPMSAAAETFRAMLETESARLSDRWRLS